MDKQRAEMERMFQQKLQKAQEEVGCLFCLKDAWGISHSDQTTTFKRVIYSLQH